MSNVLWKIELFGGLRAVCADQILTRFRTQKTAALLARLAYSPNTALSRDELMEMLWPDVAPGEGRNRLNVELSALRKALALPRFSQAAALTCSRFTIALNTDVATTDVAAFEAAQHRARRVGSVQEQLDGLKEAVDLYNGPLLPLLEQSWVAPARTHLANRYADLNGRLVALLETQGHRDQAIEYARRAAHFDPDCEEAQEILIRTLLNAHQPTSALKQCEEWKRRLADDGSSPSAALARLAQEALRSSKTVSVTLNASPDNPQPDAVTAASDNGVSLVSEPWPTGTVTLFVTDIEGSTQLTHRLKERYEIVRERHHELMRTQFRLHNGHEYKEVGDGFWVVFANTGDALACAVSCQRALSGEVWPADTNDLRVRIGLHAADVERKDGEYRGVGLHHISRIVQAAHGGQILVSQTAAQLAQSTLKAGMKLASLGEFRLRDAPAPETLFQLYYPDIAQTQFPVPVAPRACMPSLPPTFTRFIGREAEQEQLRALLLDPSTRLVTLMGTAGMGKTRLALETARGLCDAFAGAVYFVPLEAATTAAQIAENILVALRQERAPDKDALEQAAEVLNAQPTLLVLDNFEKLVDEGADVAQDLLHRVPTLTCLVTSQRSLALSVEQEFEVTTLPTPKEQDWQPPKQTGQQLPQLAALNPHLETLPSVELFVERARKNKLDFQLTPRNQAAIAELCARLEGIPLALELAASWIKSLTPTEMLRELKDVLVARDRDVPERHRSLDAAIEASYKLLKPDLQRFFLCLSAFRGGWTVEAARAVCGEPQTRRFLTQLRERSLIQADDNEEETRYRLLESLRHFGDERLQASGGQEAVRECHLAYFRELVEQADPQLQGAEQAEWLRRLEAERQNLRAALTYADVENRLEMAANLQWFWIIRAQLQEGRAWLEGALSRRSDKTDALTLKARNAAGILAWHACDFPAAREHFNTCLKLYQNDGNERGVALSLVNLANLASYQSDHATAYADYERSLVIWRKLGEKRSIAITLSNLGAAATAIKDYSAARRFLEEAVDIQQHSVQTGIYANTLFNLALVYLEEQNDRVYACIQKCLQIWQELEDQLSLCKLLLPVIWIMQKAAKYERAAWLTGAVQAAWERVNAPIPSEARDELEATISKLQSQLPADVYANAVQSGRNAPWSEVVAAIQAVGNPSDSAVFG